MSITERIIRLLEDLHKMPGGRLERKLSLVGDHLLKESKKIEAIDNEESLFDNLPFE